MLFGSVKKYLKIIAVLTMLSFVPCDAFAQFYLKKDNDTASSEDQSGGNKPVFIKPSFSGKKQVYSPPSASAPNNNSSSSNVTNKSGQFVLEKKDYSAKIAPPSPPPPTPQKPVCTAREKKIYDSIQEMNLKYMKASQTGYSTKYNGDGSVSYTYSKEMQNTMKQYQKAWESIQSDPVKLKQYIQLAVKCGGS